MKSLKGILIDCGKKNPRFMKMLRSLLKCKNTLKYLCYYIVNRVDDKVILFESFMGRNYSDSPKAIYEYMLNDPKYKEYRFVWFFKEPENYRYLEGQHNTSVYLYGSNKHLQYYAKAKYWITNSSMQEYIIKKANQIYLQCWHGTPLKRLGFDISVEGGNAMNSVAGIRKKYATDAKKYDYMISPSAFCTEKFSSAFHLKEMGKEDVLIETGYPRNDFLVNHTTENVKKIKEELKLPADKKVILYAPTFRDNQHQSDLGYTYKTEVDFDYLKSKLQEDYIILFRAHYFVANGFDFEKYQGFVYNVSDYNDVNELYVISDLLITDYSSVFFDYSILKRPIIFYMYDLKEYKNNIRDFYIDLNELPGNIVEDEENLVNEIVKQNGFVLHEKYNRFNEKFTYLDDGEAAKRVAEVLINS